MNWLIPLILLTVSIVIGLVAEDVMVKGIEDDSKTQ